MDHPDPIYDLSFAIADMQTGKQLSQLSHIPTIKWVSEVKLYMQHFYSSCS